MNTLIKMVFNMNSHNNDSINKNKDFSDRLAFVDFKLRFTGFISRLDLKEAFGIAEAAASRVLTEYNEKKPHNKTPKTNIIIRDTFSPLIDIDGETALGMLANGFNKNKLTKDNLITYEKIGLIPNQLKIEEVAKITRAINGGYAITCKYLSHNSKNHQRRTLLPLAIMHDGTQWMFRAFYRGENTFKIYNFSRATEVIEKYEDKEFKRQPKEELTQDEKWNLRLPLILKPHSDLGDEDRSEIKIDFGISNETNELVITVREPFLWLLKQKWYIDDRSKEIKKRDQENNISKYYKFEIVNKEMLDKLSKP